MYIQGSQSYSNKLRNDFIPGILTALLDDTPLATKLH